MLFYIDRVPDRHFDWFAEGWPCFIRSDYGDIAGGSKQSAPMMVLLLAAGSILGSLGSLNLVQRIDGTVLMRILGILLIYSSYKMIFPPAQKF